MKLSRMLAGLAFAAALLFAAPAMASVKAVVNKSTQQMQVYQDGALLYTWDVSTGLKNSWTPTGTFGVQSMDATHRSSIYGGAPMPWSVFFNGNIAVHGTIKANYADLGSPASHGCVRLHQTNAKTFFNLVEEVGRSNVTIIVTS